jgi:hypothetical protein
MLMSSITLDAAMTASAVLERLARNGFWRDPADRAAKAWISEYAKRTGVSVDEAARRLARDPWRVGAAIRRQWFANVIWYARPLEEVLFRCSNAPSDEPLLSVLNLHEHDGRPPIPASDEAPAAEGVVFAGQTPVGVSLQQAMAAAQPPSRSVRRNGGSEPPPISAPMPDFSVGGGTRATRSRAPRAAAPPQEISAWPRLDAPEYVPARKPFPVVVGLAAEQQQAVAGGKVTLKVPASVKSVDVSIELIADGVDAPDGWTKTLRVDVANPTANSVMFQLVGRDPSGPEPVHLTTLEVRYVLDGTVCGTASRALVIGKSDAPVAAPAPGLGTPWTAQAPSASPITLQRDEHPADLTIEIAKTDGNAASGRFQCRLYSSHAPAGVGPFPIDLGEDAKTFAKSVVQQIRDFSGDPIVDNLLRSVGGLVAEKLPAEFFSALRSIAQAIAPRVPSVLLVSADAYVPWELAAVDPPLDPSRPPYLGAQTVMGRWLRDPRDVAAAGAAPVRPVAKPPAQPPSTIGVKHMAVMAGLYKAESGLRNLPEAEAEATALAKSYTAVPLAANLTDVKRMLDAKLSQGFNAIGGVEAIHFAGHGDFDPAQTDSSVLMLSEGRPLPSIMFRSANYGGEKQPQPLFFLNGCMIGIGGELLGDMGGFPGNCLKGGFGGVVGALWEVDDKVAHQIALEFWQRALPTDDEEPVPVGEILRDLRAKYSAAAAQPESTYLAYVYYGHPQLTLQRVQ